MHHTKPIFIILRIISISLVVAAGVLVYVQYQQYQHLATGFPTGSVIANIPVSGLSEAQAADRVSQAYNTPLELHYKKAVIQASPTELGFSLNLDEMLRQARTQSSRVSFIDFLQNRVPSPAKVDLLSSFQADTLRAYLQKQVSARYDQFSTAAVPVAGSADYKPGSSGSQMDISAAVPIIKDALLSLTNRTVDLDVKPSPALPPDFHNLQVQLKQIFHVANFDGIAELYLKDERNDQVIHFALNNGQDVQTGISFTAASTMKIPIMISVLRRAGQTVPDNIHQLMERMIVYSENPASDSLMEFVDPTSGPLLITDDLQKLGYKNTFIAGFFHLGAPLLKRYQTPANTRTDINLAPDVYNQTTPEEIGSLLDSIYKCSINTKSQLTQVFAGEINQQKCELMLDLLSHNKIGLLIEAGVPDGTRVAHKHGWIEESDNLLHTMSDVAVVYTPGGNYVLTIYIYRSEQLYFDPANAMIAQLSEAVYNYFNVPQQ